MTAQFELFVTEEPQVPRLGHVERIWQLAFSDEVKAEVMRVFQSKGNQWLDWNDFRTIIDRHKIGSCFGHLLGRMARDGLILEQLRYHGAQYPGDGQGVYEGFSSRYAAIGTDGPLVVTHVYYKKPVDLFSSRRKAAA